jgi:hypothetical protein
LSNLYFRFYKLTRCELAQIFQAYSNASMSVILSILVMVPNILSGRYCATTLRNDSTNKISTKVLVNQANKLYLSCGWQFCQPQDWESLSAVQLHCFGWLPKAKRTNGTNYQERTKRKEYYNLHSFLVQFFVLFSNTVQWVWFFMIFQVYNCCLTSLDTSMTNSTASKYTKYFVIYA